MTMYRQGDLLFISTKGEARGRPIPRDERGRIIVAEGEATGHAHAIESEGAVLREVFAGDMFLEVAEVAGVDVVHEQHDPIRLEQGTWKVVRQREYVYDASTWNRTRRITD